MTTLTEVWINEIGGRDRLRLLGVGKSHQDIPMIFLVFIPCKLDFCKKKKQTNFKCFDKSVIWKGRIHFNKLNTSNVYDTSSHFYTLS